MKEWVRIKVPGLKLIGEDLERMGKDLGSEKALMAMKAAMMPVKQEMRARAPTKSSALKNSIRITGKRDERGLLVSVIAGKNAPRKPGKAVYALQVEFGTEDTPEKPFVRPAFDGNETKISMRLAALLRNSIIKWKNHGHRSKGK